jgi:hypothetical protein
MVNAVCSRRSRRSWRRCGLVGSTVVRATISLTAALLLLLVASVLTVCLVLHCCAACRTSGHDQHDCCLCAGVVESWGLDVMNLSFVVDLAQPDVFFVCLK